MTPIVLRHRTAPRRTFAWIAAILTTVMIADAVRPAPNVPGGQAPIGSAAGDGSTYVLSLQAAVTSGGAAALGGETHASLGIAGQTVTGRSAGGGLTVHHGALAVLRRSPTLQPPIQIVAEVVSGYRIDVDWLDVTDGEQGFTIERRAEGEPAFSVIGFTAADESEYLDLTVLPGTTYTYRVRAFAGAAVSPWSNEASATTPLPGDLNIDGVVDIADLSRMATFFGLRDTAIWGQGDANGDGHVDIADLSVLATNFGRSLPSQGQGDGAASNARTVEGDGPVVSRVEPAYDVIDLGDLGGRDSYAVDINDRGDVVGHARRADLSLHAFLWSSGVMRDIAPPGAVSSRAYGIDRRARVIGDAADTQGLTTAFMLDRGRHTAITPFADRMNQAHYGRAIAPHAAVGFFPDATTGRAIAFIAAGDRLSLIPSTFDQSIWPAAVNERGDVVGHAHTSDGQTHAFLYRGRYFVNLGSVTGGGAAAAINRHGQIVGHFRTADGQTRAALWYRDRQYDLGSLGGPYAAALDVNDRGQIVGSAIDRGGQRRAFVQTRPDPMRDLNGLIDPDAGWLLIEAAAINNRGMIVGHGLRGSATRAYMLVPRNAPQGIDP